MSEFDDMTDDDDHAEKVGDLVQQWRASADEIAIRIAAFEGTPSFGPAPKHWRTEMEVLRLCANDLAKTFVIKPTRQP